MPPVRQRALKERMEREQIGETVRVYGCPAEEIVIGKIRMNEQGVFDEAVCYSYMASI